MEHESSRSDLKFRGTVSLELMILTRPSERRHVVNIASTAGHLVSCVNEALTRAVHRSEDGPPSQAHALCVHEGGAQQRSDGAIYC